jgi:hypothetical protein
MCEMFKIFSKHLEHYPPLEIWNFNHVHVVANVWLIICLFHRIALLTSTNFSDFFLAKFCHAMSLEKRLQTPNRSLWEKIH